MNRICGRCAIVLLLLLTAPVLSAQDLSFLDEAEPYLWPTDASTYISSTFGETRAAHFHAGLDIRTWGREGYRVLATRGGVVHRLFISPYGYGKMITLRHDDGSYSLYAHLNRFEESIMTLADSIRISQGNRFPLDELVEEKNIRVEQGDLIGFTGSTGAGPPHLHFELRTPGNEPFNPLLTNLEVEDTIPPVFDDLGVEHLNPKSLETERIQTRSARRSDGTTRFGTIEASGPIGLSVNVHDRANRTPNIYAVHRLRLIHESDTLFQSTVDAFDYENAREMFIDRVFPLLRERRQGFQRLYTVGANRLPFYRTGPTRGVVDLPEGTYTLRIEALDYFDNLSRATVEIRVTDRSHPPSEEIVSIPAYPRADSLGGRPARPLRTPAPPNPMLTEVNRNRAGPSEPNPGNFSDNPMLFDRNDTGRTSRKKLIPGQRQFLSSPDRKVWIEFPETALFDTLHAELHVRYRDSLPEISLYPEHIPLRRHAILHVISPNNADEDSRIGLFALDRRRDRENLIASGTGRSLLRARIGEFQEYRLSVDDSLPVIGSPRIHNNLAGNPVVSVPVRDSRSGIDYIRSRILVNGKEAITEYDPDRNRLIYYSPGFRPDRRNRVEVIAYDRMGNRSERIFDAVPGQ